MVADQSNKKQQNLNPVNPSRRKAVKTIVAGTGAIAAYNAFPTHWSKPIIDQVFLPAHAQTSGEPSISDPCSIEYISGNQSSRSVSIRAMGFVTPGIQGLPVEIIATPVGAGSSVSMNTTTSASGTFTADITLSGGPGITSVAVQSTVAGASGVAGCSIDIPCTDNTLDCRFSSSGQPYQVVTGGEYFLTIQGEVTATSNCGADFNGARVRLTGSFTPTGGSTTTLNEIIVLDAAGEFDGSFEISVDVDSIIWITSISYEVTFEDDTRLGSGVCRGGGGGVG